MRPPHSRLAGAGVALVVALSAIAATPAPLQTTDLAALEWLEGEWHRDTARGVAAGVGLVGEVALLPADADAEIPTESLLLVAMGPDIFYIARPLENPYPVGFRLVSLTDDATVFENPTHDFPQRLIYRRVSDDAMTASIEGPGDDGGLQRIDFEFVRAPRPFPPRAGAIPPSPD